MNIHLLICSVCTYEDLKIKKWMKQPENVSMATQKYIWRTELVKTTCNAQRCMKSII